MGEGYGDGTQVGEFLEPVVLRGAQVHVRWAVKGVIGHKGGGGGGGGGGGDDGSGPRYAPRGDALVHVADPAPARVPEGVAAAQVGLVAGAVRGATDGPRAQRGVDTALRLGRLLTAAKIGVRTQELLDSRCDVFLWRFWHPDALRPGLVGGLWRGQFGFAVDNREVWERRPACVLVGAGRDEVCATDGCWLPYHGAGKGCCACVCVCVLCVRARMLWGCVCACMFVCVCGRGFWHVCRNAS